MSRFVWWALTGITMLSLSAYLAHAITSGDRRVFLPGETSAGHHQIEERCELCHSESFTDQDAIQEACVSCHGEELRQVEDSHPRSKFTDPRNADRVAILDARFCATCHREHVPRATAAMGVTLPDDYCFHCHQTIGEERPSHAGLPYAGCAASGCHNFHDNKALYEDFLLRHADEPALLTKPRLPERDVEHGRRSERPPIARSEVDAPDESTWRPTPERVSNWAVAIHARGGVNCSGCHAPEGATWSVAVPPAVCGSCHEDEHADFEASRHGMRWAADLSPMRPAAARIPMRESAAEHAVDCSACHEAHFFDTQAAATEACLGCHADRHSLAFEASPHAAEPAASDANPDPEPLSCASCHLPRTERRDGSVHVAHNQNANLRPSDKMVRGVCMQCHGLGFSLDALADRTLVERNFDREPTTHVPSIDWALERLEADPDRAAAERSERP